jgi:hypothetical protein
LHHVSLKVPRNSLDAEASFLTQVLVLRFEAPPELARLGANWFLELRGMKING